MRGKKKKSTTTTNKHDMTTSSNEEEIHILLAARRTVECRTAYISICFRLVRNVSNQTQKKCAELQNMLHCAGGKVKFVPII